MNISQSSKDNGGIFKKEEFIEFLMKVSILHESDMDEIEEFRKQIGSELEAIQHLSQYFQKLGDHEFKENAEATLESYKCYLAQMDEGEGIQQIQVDNVKEEEQQIVKLLINNDQEVQRSNNTSRDKLSSIKSTRKQREGDYSLNSSKYDLSLPKNSQIGIHERLYQEAVEKKEFKILMNELKQQQEIKQCTFQPIINKDFLADRDKTPVFNRLSQKKKLSAQAHELSWIRREESEISKCTFQPQVNRLKQENGGGKINHQESNVFNRLYGMNQFNSQANQIAYEPLSHRNSGKQNEELMITPSKLKNKEDFLKWKNWNQSQDESDTYSATPPRQSAFSTTQKQQQQFSNHKMSKERKQTRNTTPSKTEKQRSTQYRSISPISQKKDSKVQPQQEESVHDRLYSMHFQKQTDHLIKEIETECLQLKELTFKPNIYTQSYRSRNESPNEYVDPYLRLYQTASINQKNHESKLKEKEKELLQQLENSRPQICKHSEEIVQSKPHAPAHVRLYQNTKDKQQKSQKLFEKIQQEEGCTFKPETNCQKQNNFSQLKQISSDHNDQQNSSETNHSTASKNHSAKSGRQTPKANNKTINNNNLSFINSQLTPRQLTLKPSSPPSSNLKTFQTQRVQPSVSPASQRKPITPLGQSTKFNIKKNNFFS